MLLFVLTALIFSCMGANSVPVHLSPCKDLSCEHTITNILSYNKKMISWHTHVINETKHDLINCNLEIFKEDLKNHIKNVTCNEYEHKDKSECVLYHSLECISKVCEVPNPHTPCIPSKTSKLGNFYHKLKGFLQKLRRIQK